MNSNENFAGPSEDEMLAFLADTWVDPTEREWGTDR